MFRSKLIQGNQTFVYLSTKHGWMEERKDKNKKDSHNHGQEDKILFKYPDGYRKSLILFQKQAPFFLQS